MHIVPLLFPPLFNIEAIVQDDAASLSSDFSIPVKQEKDTALWPCLSIGQVMDPMVVHLCCRTTIMLDGLEDIRAAP